jgi:hypothetical protein
MWRRGGFVRLVVARVKYRVGEKVIERGRLWVDDDIEVLRGARLAVDHARKRANDPEDRASRNETGLTAA